MSDTPHDHGATIARRLAESRDQLAREWSRQQLAAPEQRLDLIDPETLRAQCDELLDALQQVLPAAGAESFDSDVWQPMRETLDGLSLARDDAGFDPSDTADFVLSLQRPLFATLGEATDEAEAIWWMHDVVGRMAIYTTEVFRRRREATIARQRREMEELSTPVIKVWDGILAMPLIGTLDTHRSQMVTEALLDALSASNAEIAILDLTGVPAVDTRMAQHLLRTVAAARLMGADCILSGIRPQIAQTIVHLQINLGDIATEASLASALRTAFNRAGLRVAGVDSHS